MDLPTAEITDIAQRYAEASQKLVEVWEDVGQDQFSEDNNPAIARQATQNLFEYLRIFESESAAQHSNLQNETSESSFTIDEITEMGNFGIFLLMQQTKFSLQLESQDCHDSIEPLLFPLALWLARQGAEITELEPLVNYLAKFANQITDPKQLSQLCLEIGELQDATSIRVQQDTENPARPWRIINLNRAIIATRSQNPDLMERVFHDFVQNLPEEAPTFFNQGMAQVAATNYPETARAVMEKYHKDWPLKQPLH